MRHALGLVPFVLFSFSLPAGAGEMKGAFVLASGKPAAGVTVRAIPFEEPHELALREARRLPAPAPLASATSGADGRFTLSISRPDARYVVETEGGGTALVRLDGVWDGGESDELAPVTLARGEALSGKVVDAAGRPVEGAEVTLGGSSAFAELARVSQSVRTAPDGSFSFAGALAAGNVVSAWKDGHAPARSTFVRSGAMTRPFVLSAGLPVAGVVVRADGKAAGKGVLVRWEGDAGVTRPVETDEEGRFTIAHAPAGKGTLVADAGEAGGATLSPLRLPLAEGKTLTVKLAPLASLEGRVVDAATLRPLARVKLAVASEDGKRLLRSGADGRYRVSLAAGRAQVVADDARYAPFRKLVPWLPPGEKRPLDVVLVPAATLAGRVVDEKGVPVADAAGTVNRSAADGWSDHPSFRSARDGSFRATRLAAGENQTLSVTHPDFEAAVLGGISVAPGGVKGGVTVVLRRGSSISGRVHDAEGKPIPDVSVDLSIVNVNRSGRSYGHDFEQQRPPVPTDANGRFTLRGVPPREWAVDFEKRGWAREEIPVKVAGDAAPAPLDVTLVPGAAIRGVIRSRSGVPVPGLRVVARPGGFSEQPSGEDGAFVLESLKPGKSYDLFVVASPMRVPQKSGVVAPAEGVELVTDGLGSVRGRALDGRTSRPLPDFTVSARGDAGGGAGMYVTAPGESRRPGGPLPVHAEDGVFVLDELPAGKYTVEVQAKAYQTARVSGILVEEGKTHEDVEVRLSPGGTLSGRVVDARSGRGVPAADVLPQPASGSARMRFAGATTDADGRFALEGLAPQRYKVTARHPDYADASDTVELKEEGGTVELKMAAGGAIGGVVVGADRQPVAGADVSLSDRGDGYGGRGRSATTDASGRFRVDHLGAGRYEVSADLRDLSSPVVDAVLAPGESKEDLVLSLGAGITIRGVLTGLPEAQRANASAMANGPDGWYAMARVGADARFELTGAPAGAITLRAVAMDTSGNARQTSKQVVASDAQPVLEVELAFEQGFTLSGRVTRGGRPAPGLMVAAGIPGGGGTGGSAQTDGSGAYRIEGLPAGRYIVGTFGQPGVGSRRKEDVDISADRTLDLDIPAARLAGTVVEAGSKRPLADADVRATADAPTLFRSARTDSNGRFTLEDLDPRSYALTVQKTDFLAERRDAAATEEGGEDVAIELTRGAGIGIEVKDGIYGIPLKGLYARALDAARRPVFADAVELDAEGRGEIPSLPPGVYALTLFARGYASLSLPQVSVPSRTLGVAMTPGGALEVHLGEKTLAPGSVKLRIVSSSGTPLPGGAEDGTFVLSVPFRRFENIAPGAYTLAVVGGESRGFQVAEAQTAIVTLP